jgi:hypothetical protein
MRQDWPIWFEKEHRSYSGNRKFTGSWPTSCVLPELVRKFDWRKVNTDELEELELLLEESRLSDFERRRRRLITATVRLRAEGSDLAQALQKARGGEALSDAEFVATHLGFTRKEWGRKPSSADR